MEGTINLEKSSHDKLHSYCKWPDVHCEGQNEGDKVILVLRQHAVTLVPWIFNSVALLFVLVIASFFLPYFLTTRQLVVLDIFGMVVILAYVWLNILYYIFNVGIVTTTTLIDVAFENIIFKEVSAVLYERVEDVSDNAAGYFGAFFDYGDVIIQTAGEETNLKFMNVPHPAEVVRTINSLLKK